MAIRFSGGGFNIEKDWTLTPEAFAKLLAAFSPDVERAGAEYEAARARLVKMFR